MRNVDLEQRWQKRVAAIGQFIESIEEGHGARGIEEGRVTRITIRFPSEEEPEALVVVKASSPNGDAVGFVGGMDVGAAILTWRAKDARGGLKWREDKPWGG
jgi:hypothetical protein